MKIKPIVSLMILLVVVSCQEDEIKGKNTNELGVLNFQKNWERSNLNSNDLNKKEKATCYLFSGERIINLLNNPKTDKFRFVVGLTNCNLDLKTQGIDTWGGNVGMINSMFSSEKVFYDALNKLASSNQEFSASNSIAAEHLLESATALEFIKDWNRKVSGNEDMTAVVSYNNQRIRHFSIEKEVISEISQFNRFKYLGIFLGINGEGKMTTVLVGFDENKKIILPSSSGRGQINSGGVYDFTRPCPNTCG